MSDPEARILEARDRLHLVQNVHSLFTLSLPTAEDVETGQYEAVSGAADPVDDSTLLRSDIKCLPIRLQLIDIEHVTSTTDVDRLIKAFDCLLDLFEDSVVDLKEIGVDAGTPQRQQGAHYIARFPKLVSLRSLRQQLDNKPFEENTCGTDDPRTSTREQTLTPDRPSFPKNVSLHRLGELVSYINFPPPHKTISICRHEVESFGRVIADIFPDAMRIWNVGTQLEEVTDAEIEFIRETYAFSKASCSLVQRLVNSITCQADHIARLHLSGFPTHQLEMLLGTCKQDWIPMCFVFSPTAASLEPRFGHRMCAHTMAAEYHSRTIRVCFNEAMVWEDCVMERDMYDHEAETASSSTLYHFIQGLSTQAKRKPNERTRRIVEVLLACSLFKLSGSPWLQHGFEGENIFDLPKKSSVGQLNYWHPHISCHLSPYSAPKSLPEDVAALGVLILELEANLSAEWTDDDEDYETKTKSNRTRLSRILREWKELPDFCHNVGAACFQFENLVEDFDHPKVDKSLRDLTILYKCIVNPLFKKLVSEFGAAECLFQGISGLSVPTISKRASGTEHLVLYDDLESTEPDKKSYADKFVERLEDGFLYNIKSLRRNSLPIGLAETQKGMQTPGKIRIAVLDTGIDPTDKLIHAAMARIIDKKSWVGSGETFCDTYGHGTHVTRLLLQMAPAAEIYVAKITDNKNVDPEDMSRIAEAINYAVKDWDVHIISMSFGFQDQNKAIEDAIEKAFKADKLMFAAASNEGGNQGRSRPSRSPNVICIHACDGNGNKGGMSPSPEKKKDNFTTLGVAIKSRWKKQDVYKSGTSFATPVAAAIAANVLEFANLKCILSKNHKALLHKRDGMLEVFRAMSTERDGYDFVQPRHLWDGRDDEEVAEKILEILKAI